VRVSRAKAQLDDDLGDCGVMGERRFRQISAACIPSSLFRTSLACDPRRHPPLLLASARRPHQSASWRMLPAAAQQHFHDGLAVAKPARWLMASTSGSKPTTYHPGRVPAPLLPDADAAVQRNGSALVQLRAEPLARRCFEAYGRRGCAPGPAPRNSKRYANQGATEPLGMEQTRHRAGGAEVEPLPRRSKEEEPATRSRTVRPSRRGLGADPTPSRGQLRASSADHCQSPPPPAPAYALSSLEARGGRGWRRRQRRRQGCRFPGP